MAHLRMTLSSARNFRVGGVTWGYGEVGIASEWHSEGPGIVAQYLHVTSVKVVMTPEDKNDSRERPAVWGVGYSGNCASFAPRIIKGSSPLPSTRCKLLGLIGSEQSLLYATPA